MNVNELLESLEEANVEVLSCRAVGIGPDYSLLLKEKGLILVSYHGGWFEFMACSSGIYRFLIWPRLWPPHTGDWQRNDISQLGGSVKLVDFEDVLTVIKRAMS